MPLPLRVLILEDRPADAELMLHELRAAGFEPTWERVDTEADYAARLDPGLDVILADYNLPQFDATRALALLQRRGLDIPLIVVSGTLSDEMAVECMKHGAADYLLKDRLARLGLAVVQALEAKRSRDERRRAEAALRESEERFRSAFEESAIGMALQDPDGRYLRVNRALCEMLGYQPDELLATTFRAVTHPDDRDIDAEHDRRMLAGELTSYQTEKRYVGKDGQAVWALAMVSLVRTAEGVPPYFVVQVQDITELRRTAEVQAALQAQLVQGEKLAAMGSLLAGVAHELNNPLSVVLGQATLLQQTARGGPLAARADKIARAAERCARIVKNFLALARQWPPERQDVNLNDVARDAMEMLVYGLRLDSVEVALDLAADLPILWADPHQLNQVLINLVTNSHHAMRSAPPPRRLTVTTRFDRERRAVRLEVADTGPGIPAEILPRVFEPFFTTKPPGQGTGLGLPLCRGIAEAHGGTIATMPAPGRGAVFQVDLPVVARAEQEPAFAKPEPGVPRGKRVLVVDDEPELAGVLADLLAIDGHQVGTAANGALALERLGEAPFDLILSDIRMPEVDGPELYRQVKHRHPELRRRFVFITGDTLTPEVTEFLGQIGAPNLGKPFVLDEVRRVVQRALAREP